MKQFTTLGKIINQIFCIVDRKIKKVKLILTSILSILIIFQLAFSSLPLIQRFVFIGYSLLFLILGYGGIYLVLGFQVLLKLLSKERLRRWCIFFIIMPVLSLLFQYPVILHFINTADEALRVSFHYCLYGVIIGAYKIMAKYTIEKPVSE